MSTLTSGTTYYFAVEAVNGVGSSPASNVLSATPGSTVPSAPTLLSAGPGHRQVTLTYSAPSNNGGSAIISYNIYISTSAGGVWSTPVNSTPINSIPVTVKGLTRNVTYFFIVRAVKVNGVSAASNELSAKPN